MSEIKQKILNIQSELKAPKGQYNSFGKYKYRSAEDILEALKPLLVKNGLLLTISDEIELIGDRHYVKATVTVQGENSESVQVSAYAREALNKKGMDESQITGTASSYARKYALNGMWAIDDTKDSDTDEYAQRTAEKNKHEDKTKQSNNQEYITHEQRKGLQNNAIILHGRDATKAITALLGHLKVTKTNEIKTTDFEKANQFISDWRKDSEQFEL